MSSIPSEVHLPDLVSLCHFPWQTNPHFDQASEQTTDWILSYNIFDEEGKKRFVGTNGALLGAHTYTYANLEALRTCSDFLNLLFTLDEISDVQEPAGVRETRNTFANALNGIYDDSSVVSRFTQDFMKRLENSNPKFRERFIKHSIDYFDSVLPEAEHRIKDSVMTLDEYIPHRRENGGVKPCFDLFEYCFDIDLPDEVFEDEAFIRVCDAAIDCVGWSNDAYSYAAELSRGLEGNNALTILMRTKGLSITEALAYVEQEFAGFLRIIDQGKKEIKSYGPKVDAAIRSYIHGCEQWVYGNCVWCFDSQRYFGSAHEEVKRTMVVKLKNPKAVN